jgi:hypothetical protein
MNNNLIKLTLLISMGMLINTWQVDDKTPKTPTTPVTPAKGKIDKWGQGNGEKVYCDVKFKMRYDIEF